MASPARGLGAALWTTMHTVLRDHVSIGYTAIRMARLEPGLPSAYLPDPFVSASACLATMGPWTWWTSHLETMLDRFELTPRRAEYVSWAEARESAGRLLPIDVAADLALAREFVHRFCGHLRDVVLCGLALPSDLADEFVGDGYPPRHGLDILAARREHPSAGGTTLGYEPLGREGGDAFHSWTCNGLQPDALRAAGVSVNAHGMIDRLDDAIRVVEFINRNDTGAEPGLWSPVLLTTYEVS